jgi:serine protease Do
MASARAAAAAVVVALLVAIALPPAAARTASDRPLADVVAEVTPPVVNVSTRSVGRPGHTVRRDESDSSGGDDDEGGSATDPFEQFFGHLFQGPRRPELKRSLGSGVIIDRAGYVLTNNHVVGDATEIKVTLADERSYPAKLVGRDARTDVALLKIEAPHLPAARLGDSDTIRVGDPVIAVGNPFGLSQTVTTGIVSAKGRVIGAGPYDDFIQTDASINPGNSGGPLYNLDGEVIGLNTAIVESARGIGFAIPVNLVKSVLPQLRRHGEVTRGFLGVAVQHVTPELARAFRLPAPSGALVAQVDPDGPAARAGVKSGDVILAVEGHKVPSSDRLPEMVALLPPGSHARLDLVRDGQTIQATAVVGALREPEERKPVSGTSTRRPRHPSTLGVAVRPLDPVQARRLGVPGGLLVEDVDPAGPAAGVLEAGDVILEVDRQPTQTPADLTHEVSRARQSRGSPVLLRIRRGSNALYVAIDHQE